MPKKRFDTWHRKDIIHFCQAQPQLNSNFNFEADIALFSDNTATQPPTHRESSNMEQDFKYFN